MRGVTVTLYSVTETGTDAFNRPIYTETAVQVENVLIAPANETEILDILNLTGKKGVYTLGIPKGDANDWENRKVSFFGENWRVIGAPQEGIEELIPLQWNRKVRVESYVDEA